MTSRLPYCHRDVFACRPCKRTSETIGVKVCFCERFRASEQTITNSCRRKALNALQKKNDEHLILSIGFAFHFTPQTTGQSSIEFINFIKFEIHGNKFSQVNTLSLKDRTGSNVFKFTEIQPVLIFSSFVHPCFFLARLCFLRVFFTVI